MDKLLLKVKKNLHFYTLSEQTPIIAIISNKWIKWRKKRKKCNHWLKLWLKPSNQQEQSSGVVLQIKFFEKLCKIIKMLRHAKAIAPVIYKGVYWVFSRFFADALLRQTEKSWNCFGILLPTYLAPEFRRLSYWSANPFFQQICVN